MAALCCPSCRLLQHAARCVDCGEHTATLYGLTRERIEGLTTVAKQPPRGWRDAIALLTTVFGMLAAGIAGAIYIAPAAGLVLGPVVAVFGYKKQFWRTAFKRRPRLVGVPPRLRPDGPALTGVAQPFERTTAGGALATATTIETQHGIIARAIDAVPFWLIVGDRRVLVSGDCWVTGLPSQRRGVTEALLREIGAVGLPLDQAGGRRVRVLRVAVGPGDRVAVVGTVREEQLSGLGGYRDTLAETVRGEPGALIWIERLEAAPPPRKQ